MIRRVTEYVVTCDGKDCYESTAYGSSTAVDCAEQAKLHEWTQKSKRLWLCPYCAEDSAESSAESLSEAQAGINQARAGLKTSLTATSTQERTV